jgi:glycosyltransferase involved in cell wall biosynthesis
MSALSEFAIETAPKAKAGSALPFDMSSRKEGGLRTKGIHKKGNPDKPVVTVITVVFNAVSTIQEAIKSVLNQSYTNIEYIVVDGGSSDGTLEVIKQYEHAIDYWVSERDAGIYDAMNKGVSLASGTYIGMLNSDDMFATHETIENVAETLITSDADAIFSCLNIVDKYDTAKILRKCRVTTLSTLLLRIGVMPPHPTFYCKKTCYTAAGPYKTDYRVVADFEMVLRMLVRQKISWEFLDQITVVMRSGGVSNNGIVARIKLNLEIIRACKESGLYTNALLLALKLPIRFFELIR